MLSLYKYSTPFRTPFKTALGTFETREGIILCYITEAFKAYGEIAPLPGFSEENLSEVETELLANKELIAEKINAEAFDELINELAQKCPFPSLLFGVDTLIHDLKAKKMGLSIQASLFGENDNQVLCNASVGLRSTEETIQQAKLNIEKGFRTIKIKVGGNFEKEVEILSSLRLAFPNLRLRIDANQAWDREEAVSNLELLSEFEIEYCEQPVSAAKPEDLKWVKERSPIKIAADESLVNKEQREQIIDNDCCDLVIIKPALFGSLKEINVTKQLVESHGMAVVFTTTLDGIIGRKITAVLASGLGSRKYAHGLGTGSFFNEPYTSGEQIRDGYYQLSAAEPGLGNPADLASLKELH